MINEAMDYYEVLELKPSASPAEIREAYFRIKATYQKDNVALYTLIDTPMREEMLQKIEEAYAVLSNPEKRRDYDKYCGQLGPAQPSPIVSNVVPLNRTAPPMDIFSNEESQLVSPKTDFDFNLRSPVMDQANQRASTPPVSIPVVEPARQTPVAYPSQFSRAKTTVLSSELETEIREQTDWSGAFLRKIREAHGISLEEITHTTKITKAYIVAIEEENYAKLPAPVFIRGFVSQLARLLKLPHQQVAASYMARFQRVHPEKTPA